MHKKISFKRSLIFSLGVLMSLRFSCGQSGRDAEENDSTTFRSGIQLQAGNSFDEPISGAGSGTLSVSVDPSKVNHVRTRTYTNDAGTTYLDAIQYYDSFGRFQQTVDMKASPNQNDLVTFVVLDNFGREGKKYLPYEASSNNGGYKPSPANEAVYFYGQTPPVGHQSDNKPWSETIFDDPVHNRPLKQIGEGVSWHGATGDWHSNGKYAAFNYRTNTANEVRLWKAYDTKVESTGCYPVKSLYVNESTDEDGRKTIEYIDMQGRTVRQQQWVTGSDYAITDYVYDGYGRLRYVLPPSIVKTADKTITEPTNASSEFAQYVYAYKYNGREQVVEKHIPGAGWTYIIYNKLDQPVLIQDAIQRETGQWSFTKYDAHGRVVMTGLYHSSAGQTALQNSVNSGPKWEERGNQLYAYTNQCFPQISEPDILTVNYYDDYDFPDSESYQEADNHVQGLATGNKTRILGTDDWLTSTLFYDNKRRIIRTVSDQPGVGGSAVKDIIDCQYDFAGNLTRSRRDHQKGGTSAFVLTEINRYDHAGRLLEVKQHITGGDTVVAVTHAYNELGELIRTDLHNSTLESTEYSYNIRGWLKEIAGSHFSQKLHYHESVNGLASTPQWGGNISAMEWQTPSMNGYWHAYGFGYDPLSRLTGGNYSRSTSEENTVYGSESGHFNEDYSYDIMGNITGLNRYHGGEQIDSLTLSYNGNQLGQASDAIIHEEDEDSSGTGITRVITLNSPAAAGIQEACEGFVLQPGFQFAATSGNELTLRINEQLCTSEPSTPGFIGNGTYGYDVAGRMTTDSNKGITIAYNHLNLPTLITKDQETLEYTYDATGRRIRKKFGSKERHYIDGVEYEGSELKFISTQYGRIRKTTSGWVYDYFLKDHLGNVRVVLTSDPDNVQRYMATMEEGKSGEEGLYFDNLESTRSARPYNYPDKNPSNAKLAKVAGKSQGPRITLKVMAGDTIEISAQAFYNIDKSLPGSGLDIAPVAASAIAALSGNAAAPLGEFSTLATDLGATASTSAVLAPLPGGNDDEDSPQPESGLNFVLYNREFEVVEAHTGLLPVDDRINKIQQLSGDKMVLSESGYMEIYVNNEAQTPVYFDNLSVTRSSGNAVEVNAYYPYGMIIPLLSDHEIDGFNAYKYNAKELQELTGWLDFGNRMQDPTIGRFMVPDRFAEKYYHLSPYSYTAGNPVNLIDINGDSIWIRYDDQRILYTQGMEYDGDEFVKSVVNVLNALSKGTFGGYMIGELQKSEFGFNISQGKVDRSVATPNFNDPMMKKDNGVYKTGADITWDGNNSMDLGHEMAHGYDVMNGYDINKTLIDNMFGMPEGEVRAVHMENILRAENGMPLRTHYFSVKEGGYDLSRPALVVNGKEVRFGYDYKNNPNVPYNYGNGVYGTLRKVKGMAPTIQVKSLNFPK